MITRHVLLLDDQALIAARYEAIGALFNLAVARGMSVTDASDLAGRSYVNKTTDLANLAGRKASAMDKYAVPKFYERRYRSR